MAFSVQNWARSSVSAAEPIVTLADASVVGCFREYNYYTADSQSTVSASGYFNAGTAYNGVGTEVVTGDYVNVYSTTDSTLSVYRLTNTSGVITTSFVSGTVSARVAATAAQINAMYTTPITLLAAPGANRQYIFLGANVTIDYGSAQFASGGAMHVQYATTTAGGGTKASATVADTVLTGITADSSFTFIPAAVVATAVASIVNQPLCLSNATGVFTTGTGSTAVIGITAAIVPTA